MTRVLALFEDPDGPSARLRFDLFRPALDDAGCRVHRAGIPRSLAARLSLFRRARDADVTYVQRRLLPGWQVRRLRSWSRRLVFDVDDAIGLKDRPPFRSWTRRRRLGAWLRAADAVIVGSEDLSSHVREARGVRTVVPTTVASGPLPGEPEPGRILWLGQPSTYRYLRALTPFLVEAEARVPGLCWVLLGAGEVGFSGLAQVETPSWSETRERTELARATLGLAPLPDDPWTRGKCAARLHRYLSHGVPAVASPVGAQRRVGEVCSGVRLVGDPEQWGTAVAEMVRIKHDRSAIQQAWAAQFSPERWQQRWLGAVLGDAASGPGSRACAGNGEAP